MVTYKKIAILVSLALCMLFLSSISAENKEYAPIFSSIFSIVNVSWSNDGGLLTFQEANGTVGVQNLEANNWHAYNVDRKTLSTSSLWPLPILTPQGLSLNQNAAPELKNEPNFSFQSPKNRYLVYPAELSGDLGTICNLLVIADMQSHSATLVKDVTLCDINHFENGFNIQWSADETAFTVYTALPTVSNVLYYVSGYAETLEKITATEITEFSIGDNRFGVTRPFGLNSDGSEVLVSTTTNQDDQTVSALVVYNVRTPDQSQVIKFGNTVRGAVFLTNDDQTILYISSDGLDQYNLKTKKSAVLISDINTAWVKRAWFSPDGKHIALYERQDLEKNNLYVVDVPTP